MFWVALLALHTLALPSLVASLTKTSVTEQLALVPRIAGLALSAAFFTLKFFDVAWLRTDWDWQRVVAAVLIVGLLHVGVIDRALASPVESNSMPWLFVGAVVGTAMLIRRLRAHLALCFPQVGEPADRPFNLSAALHRAWRPHELASHSLFLALRAPPAV